MSTQTRDRNIKDGKMGGKPEGEDEREGTRTANVRRWSTASHRRPC